MLKLIAALLMVVDHFAVVFLPSSSGIYVLCRIIGRLSMPIFAYKVASGFLYTKNFKKYASRIFSMTLLAQIPFTWLISGDQFFFTLKTTRGLSLLYYWNIGLTFLCALFILKLLEKRSLSSILLIIPLCIIGNLGDYGLYGIVMIVVFYYYQKHSISFQRCSLFLFILCILQALSFGMTYFQSVLSNTLPALLSLPLIKYVPDTSIKLPKNFFYLFYPGHMFILLLINEILRF